MGVRDKGIQTTSLGVGDEVVIGPASRACRIEYMVLGADGPMNDVQEAVSIQIRNGLDYRDGIIEGLRRRIAELEAAEASDASRVADAVIDGLVERLGGRLG